LCAAIRSAGEIAVIDDSGAFAIPVAHVEVGADGSFSVVVPPGKYSVQGRSRYYNGGRTPCFAKKPVAVTAGTSIETDVVCQVK
jgi:hypothetical protein